jgi:hypothetical protein
MVQRGRAILAAADVVGKCDSGEGVFITSKQIVYGVVIINRPHAICN